MKGIIMAETVTFTKALIGTTLTGLGIKFLQDADGDYWAIFGDDDGKQLYILFQASGPDEDILTVGAIMLQAVFPEERAQVLGILNRWNTENRWPKVYLHDSLKKVVAVLQVPLYEGIHPEGLTCMIAVAIDAIRQHTNWLHEEMAKLHQESLANLERLWLWQDSL